MTTDHEMKRGVIASDRIQLHPSVYVIAVAWEYIQL